MLQLNFNEICLFDNKINQCTACHYQIFITHFPVQSPRVVQTVVNKQIELVEVEKYQMSFMDTTSFTHNIAQKYF